LYYITGTEPSSPWEWWAQHKVWAVVERGQTTADITVPTVADNLGEPDEFLQMELYGSLPDRPLPTITGRVTD
jgi:hypothetical protein